eukprot:scaffold104844_cov54-Phaeocystis_antarctica.AAC.1
MAAVLVSELRSPRSDGVRTSTDNLVGCGMVVWKPYLSLGSWVRSSFGSATYLRLRFITQSTFYVLPALPRAAAIRLYSRSEFLFSIRNSKITPSPNGMLMWLEWRHTVSCASTANAPVSRVLCPASSSSTGDNSLHLHEHLPLLARRRAARLRVPQPRCLGGDRQSHSVVAAEDLLCNSHGIAQNSLRFDEGAGGAQQVSHDADRDQRVWVAVAQRLPLRLQRLLVQRPRLLQLAHLLQQHAHAGDRAQRARVAVAPRLPARLQRLLEQQPRLLQLAQVLQQHAHVVDRAQRFRVAVAQRLPHPLQRLLEQRPRLHQLAHLPKQPAHVAERAQRVRVAVAQRLLSPLQCLLEQRPRLLQLAHVRQQVAHEVDCGQRLRVAVAQRLPPRLQRLLEQRPRLLQLARLPQHPAQGVLIAEPDELRRLHPLGRRQPPQRRPRLSDQRLAQQADDQRVARDEAHALLQLIQNGLVFLGVVACGGAHVHLGQARLDRKEVFDEHPFIGSLLRRGHHHVELRAALLRVVDLLDAVGALERGGRVPRLHQQHRVPYGADAVAEQLQVGVHVGLPDHVVAHPEERVLLPQPLLLEEVGERVEQRGDRRGEGPAHEHGSFAHPLAHGHPVPRLALLALGLEGGEEPVDVAVLRYALGVLGLARLLVDRNLGVELLHRVARQPR